MLAYFFGSYTTEQKLELAVKAKSDLESQIKQLNTQLSVKEEEISKLRKELGLPEVVMAPPPPPAELIPVNINIKFANAMVAKSASGETTTDVVSDFAVRFRPDMSKEQRDEVMRSIREERQFRIKLLPPNEQVKSGFGAVMEQMKNLRSLYAGPVVEDSNDY